MKTYIVEKSEQEFPEEGLTPLAMKKLPAGAIHPSGWLERQLQIALQGLPGQLWKTGAFLQETNGWLTPEKIFIGSWNNTDRPWEEQAYYLRTLVLLAIYTQDEQTLAVVEKYMKKLLESREEDGWFGPQSLKYFHSDDPEEKATMLDLWPGMVMCEAVLSWYEYTKEEVYLDMLHRFFYFCLAIPDEEFIPAKKPGKGFSWLPSIQHPRSCDILPAIYRVIEATGDHALFPLVHRFYRKWHGAASEFMNIHTVNFAQQFAYSTYYSRLAHEKYLHDSACYWYDQHMMVWGTVPRGSFCADENIRKNCTDPRYGMESCTFSELLRSFCYLGEMDMDPVWADRAEDVLFNHYPASYTHDMKKVHYITSSNQVMLDDYLYHNVANSSHMFAYTDTNDRCCLHNAGLAWELYASNMMTSVHDGGICAYLHGPYTAHLTAGQEKVPLKCISETSYPFRDRIRFTLQMEKPCSFPFYIRVPRWCSEPEFFLNGQKVTVGGNNIQGNFFVLEKEWCSNDTIEVYFPSKITVSRNIRNGGITVNKGALSYSLQIREKVNIVVSSRERNNPAKAQWDEKNSAEGDIWTELLPDSDWNYGLLPEEGFIFEELPLPEEYPFYWETPPNIIRAKGRKIPNWTLQDHMCAELQKSPVKSNEKTEDLTLIPMGCARLRLSVFPVIADTPWANEWKKVPEMTLPEERPPIRL